MPVSSRRHRRNFNLPGHAHELTWSCYHGFPFLSRERTCLWLVDAIQLAREQFHFDLWAYVFMPEHVHLILHPRLHVYDMAAIRQAIKEPVARKAVQWLEDNAPEWIPRITTKKGDRQRRHFWQAGGGYDRNIEEPRTLLKMVDYVHHNPCRRGLVERAVDWKWSSAGWYQGDRNGPLAMDLILPEWLCE